MSTAAPSAVASPALNPIPSSSSSTSSMRAVGEELWKRQDKANADLLLQLYGSFVRAMWTEVGDPAKIVAHQRRFGRDIGARLADDFFAKSSVGKCRDLRESADVVAKAAFKMFLNITPTVVDLSLDGREFSLQFDEDPLLIGTDNQVVVALPEQLARAAFSYSGGLYAAVLEGAYSAIGLHVDCQVKADRLLGADSTVVRVVFVRQAAEPKPPSEDD